MGILLAFIIFLSDSGETHREPHNKLPFTNVTVMSNAFFAYLHNYGLWVAARKWHDRYQEAADCSLVKGPG
jgi:hypothetical protein